MKKIKGWLLVGVVGLIVVMAVINLRSKKVTPQKETEEREARPTVEVVEEGVDPFPIKLARPERLVWQIGEKTDWPEKVKGLEITPKAIGQEEIVSFLGLVGMKTEQKVSENGELVVFEEGKKRSAYVDRNSMVLGFVENITSREQLKGEGEGSLLEGERVIKELAKKIGGMEVRVVARENKKLLYPRWVAAKPEEAEATEIRAVYVVDGYPLFSFTGELIKATITAKGRILKLEIGLGKKVETKEEVGVLGVEEIETLGVDKVWVWKKEGTLGFEGSDFEEKVSLVNVTEIEAVYIENGKGKAGIYLLGKGNGIIGKQPAKITIIVPIGR